MRLAISSLLCTVALALGAQTTVNLGGTDYEVDRLIDRQIAPGVQYVRYRVPAYPLNINVLTINLNNPYNRIENTIPYDRAYGTESLVNAAARQSHEGHRAVAGANANFWVVSGGIDSPAYDGTTRNGSMHNGQIVTEANQFNDQFDYGTMSTGVIGVSTDRQVYIDRCTADLVMSSEKTGPLTIHECNKGVKPNELCMYNNLYGADRAFKPVTMNWKEETGVGATEVILDLAEGEQWKCAEIMNFVVKEVRLDAGTGTLGDHDLALVGRDYFRDAMALLQPGDAVQLLYQWNFRPDNPEQAVTPVLENLVGGNAMIMIDGENTANNDFQEYNSMVYSRCCYGRSADRKTMYIVVVDKSTDPVYGQSAGCTTSIVCDFMKTLGCTDLSNCDAGGSAQMLIGDRIINKTTESNPRAVGNGMLIYSTAPDDNEVATLAFDEISLRAPIYGQFSPKVIAYNKYGYPIDYEFSDFTLSCDPQIGTCEGNVFTAAGTPCRGTLTATYGEASVSAEIEVLEAQIGLRLKQIVLDQYTHYPIEVEATIGQQTYTYDPASIDFTVDDENVAKVRPNGVLYAVDNGTTTLTARIGDFTDQATVKVQILYASSMSLMPLTDWTVKGAAGMNNAALTADGTISFNYASPRDAYVQISNPTELYALPGELSLTFSPSIPVAQVSFDLRTPFHDRANILTATCNNLGEAFEAGKSHLVVVDLNEYFDVHDVGNYPVTLHYVRFTCERDASYKGEQSIKIDNLSSQYPNYVNSVEEVRADIAPSLQLIPGCVAPGGNFAVSTAEDARVEIVSLGGTVLGSAASTGAVSLTAPNAPGIYIVVARTASDVRSAKLVVK